MKVIAKIYQQALANPILAIVIVALLARIIICICYQHITIYPDSTGYIELSELLSNFNLSGYEGQRSPGYPLLLLLSLGIPFLAAVLQIGLGILTLIVFYKTLIQVKVADKVALAIALLASIYIPSIFYELAILSEALSLFIVTYIVYLLTCISTKRNIYWKLSMACAFLVLIKPFYIFLPVLICLFFTLDRESNKLSIKRIVLFPLLSLFVFWGWSSVNKINTGYFAPTTFYGFNLAQNCVSFAEHTTDEYSSIGLIYAEYRDKNIEQGRNTAMSIWEAQSALESETGLSFPDMSERLYRYSIATIKLNPIAYIKQVSISWFDFWKTSFYYEKEAFAYSKVGNMIQYMGNGERVFLQLIKWGFILLIPYNLYIGVRRRRLSLPAIISIIVLSASILQALATYGTNSRFSYPFELAIILSVLLNILEWKRLRKQKG